MDGSRMSNFSVERILSAQLGPRPPPHGGHLHVGPGGVRGDVGQVGPAGPGACCPQGRGASVWECAQPCAAGFHRADAHPTPGVCGPFRNRVSADARLCRGCHGYLPPWTPPDPPQRHKARMRTVFTEGQTRQLEALFERTDYPPVEARAEVARRTDLSEETVRVWFKNRRARRKRLRHCARVQAASPPGSGAAEKRP